MESLNLIPVADVSEGEMIKYTLPYRPSKYFPQDSAVRWECKHLTYMMVARRESIIPYISREKFMLPQMMILRARVARFFYFS